MDYGDRAEHCWNGDHDNGNGISRLRYNTMYLERCALPALSIAACDVTFKSADSVGAWAGS